MTRRRLRGFFGLRPLLARVPAHEQGRPRTRLPARAVLLAAIIGLWLGLAAASFAQTPGLDEMRQLRGEVKRLVQEGKSQEAIAAAERMLLHAEQQFGPEHAEVGEAASELAGILRTAGNLDRAGALYQRAIEIFLKAHGSDHVNYATALYNLALNHLAAARYVDAIQLLRSASGIYEKAVGSEDALMLQALHMLGVAYRHAAQQSEAEKAFLRVIAIREKTLAPEDPLLFSSLNSLAVLYMSMARYAEAETALKRSLAARGKAVGLEHEDVFISWINLAELYRITGRFGEAEMAYNRLLAAAERVHGSEHRRVGTMLSNLSSLYVSQGRHDEAAMNLKRAIAIFEKILPPSDPEYASAVSNLGLIYWNTGSPELAEPFFKRALEMAESTLGAEHPLVAFPLNNLSLVYHALGRTGQALELLERAFSIREKSLGPEHPDVGLTLLNLGAMHRDQGRHERAETIFRRALSIIEKEFGPEHPSTAAVFVQLSTLYSRMGRAADTEDALRRALAINEKAFGPDHPQVAEIVDNLAWVAISQRRIGDAVTHWKRSIDILSQRARLATPSTLQAARLRDSVHALANVSHRHPQRDANLAREMFAIAQWGLSSEAAQSLAQMAARAAFGNPSLSVVIRERQDLLIERKKHDDQQVAAIRLPPQQRNRSAESANLARLAAIDTRVAEIDERLKMDFPDYSALASSIPISAQDVREQLDEKEALVLFLDTRGLGRLLPEETLVWVVTRTDVRWVRSDLGTAALRREVAALRCGLDRESNWRWDAGKERFTALTDHCRALAPDGIAELPPFDLKRAHALYEGLLGGVADLIKDKHLLLVPSGPLTTLPFQVLVTETPGVGATYADAAWLGTRNALTVLPAVSSLKALRANARSSRATQAYAAFGNPLLTGADGQDKRAWAHQSCPPPSASEPPRTAVAGIERKTTSLFRNGLALVEDVRQQPPLPETAAELCTVARAQGETDPDRVVYLGERATERRIKALSADGSLARARVLHFATHGLVAGEMAQLAQGRAEPALILTPPAEATEEDDGLLTASEVASLKLDADWVLLSACNTAAGNSDGGDALSGLARAFFYAGARALLVSHWAVDNEATVALITAAFDAQKANPRIGRAEALRKAMAALIAKGGDLAHPGAWAPFIVVGEGGEGR